MGRIIRRGILGFFGLLGLAWLVAAPNYMGALSWVDMTIRRLVFNRSPVIRYDSFGRLSAYPGKPDWPCPKQTARTAVLLTAGQSNAANSSTQKFVALPGHDVVNFYQGQCYLAISPLLGASGDGGEIWTALGNRLIDSGQYDAVVIAPAAVGGTLARRWAPQGGDLWPALAQTIEEVEASSYRITHILWHQGESEFAMGVDPAAYRDQTAAIFAGLRATGLKAPIFIVQSTRCANGAAWTSLNAIALAQRGLANTQEAIFAGPDADALVGDEDRYDHCHMAKSGVEKMVAAWAAILSRGPR